MSRAYELGTHEAAGLLGFAALAGVVEVLREAGETCEVSMSATHGLRVRCDADAPAIIAADAALWLDHAPYWSCVRRPDESWLAEVQALPPAMASQLRQLSNDRGKWHPLVQPPTGTRTLATHVRALAEAAVLGWSLDRVQGPGLCLHQHAVGEAAYSSTGYHWPRLDWLAWRAMGTAGVGWATRLGTWCAQVPPSDGRWVDGEDWGRGHTRSWLVCREAVSRRLVWQAPSGIRVTVGNLVEAVMRERLLSADMRASDYDIITAIAEQRDDWHAYTREGREPTARTVAKWARHADLRITADRLGWMVEDAAEEAP